MVGNSHHMEGGNVCACFAAPMLLLLSSVSLLPWRRNCVKYIKHTTIDSRLLTFLCAVLVLRMVCRSGAVHACNHAHFISVITFGNAPLRWSKELLETLKASPPRLDIQSSGGHRRQRAQTIKVAVPLAMRTGLPRQSVHIKQ